MDVFAMSAFGGRTNGSENYLIRKPARTGSCKKASRVLSASLISLIVASLQDNLTNFSDL
jgi:hypothetical protein